MRELGVEVTPKRNGVSTRGQAPKGGSVHIRGDMSSQFISGLLLAAPLMQNGLLLNLTSQLESRGYVSLTIDAMKRHGIHVESNNQMTLLKIQSGQAYHTATHLIPGDHSSAAFPMAAAAITGSKLLIRGLSKTNNEPDSVFTQILSRMGTETHYSTDGLLVEGGRLKASRVNISDCPDLGPATAVLGCYAEGETEITGAGRLRYKESDRLGAMATELATMGAQVTSTDDRLIIRGSFSLKGGSVDSHGDHRVAMALSVAALHAKEDVTILNAECVSKSYPGFFNDLRTLGVRVVER
jgi:3-phosphoshikimate 1-carboxyvinyltransferase